LLAPLGVGSTGTDHATVIDAALDEIARTLEQCLDVDALRALAS
jgi:hypothetical protein